MSWVVSDGGDGGGGGGGGGGGAGESLLERRSLVERERGLVVVL